MSVNAAASSSSLWEPLALRKTAIALNPLPQADGSASFAFGNQQSLAALSGPTEVRIRDELTDRATLDISVLPLSGVPGIAANSFANGTLQRALASVVILQRYPRSLLQLTIQTTNQEIASTSSLNGPQSARRIRPRRPHPDAALGLTERAAHINAAMLALIQGGVACSATVCAVGVAVLPRSQAKSQRTVGRSTAVADADAMQEDNEEGNDDDSVNGTRSAVLVIDPSPTEEQHATSTHLFAFACSGSIVHCDVDGQGRETAEDAESPQTGEARLVLVESNGSISTAAVSSPLRTGEDKPPRMSC